MEGLGEYILSVVCAAILCTLVAGIAGKEQTAGKVLQLVCGLFLTLAVVRPVTAIHLDDISRFTQSLEADAAMAVGMGKDYYEDTLSSVIQEKTEAYILDKALSLGVQTKVQVVVDADHTISEVVFTGRIAPYARSRLQEILESELGIAKERQIWIGS